MGTTAGGTDQLVGDTGRLGAQDQELCRLFDEAKESGRNQEWIAKLYGKTQGWVSQRLVFGRFLRFITAVIKTESALNLDLLTERRFRWVPTD